MGRNCAALASTAANPWARPGEKPENLELCCDAIACRSASLARSSHGTRDLADSQRPPPRIRLWRNGGNHAAERLQSASARIWRCSQHGARRGARRRRCAGRRIWHRPLGEGLHRHLRRHRAAATRPLCAQRRLSLRRRGRRDDIRRECSARSRGEISRRHPGADLCDAVEDLRRHLRRRRGAKHRADECRCRRHDLRADALPVRVVSGPSTYRP